MDFIGTNLTNEELTKIWRMRVSPGTYFLLYMRDALVYAQFAIDSNISEKFWRNKKEIVENSKGMMINHNDENADDNFRSFFCVDSFLPQNGQSGLVVDNIHTIIAAAAVKFNQEQLEHLFTSVQKVGAKSNNQKITTQLTELNDELG